MQAKDIMTAKVITVTEDASVSDVARLLVDNGISALPVVDATGKLLGIVSEGDLMHRAEAGTGLRRSWWLSLFTDASVSAAQFVKEHSRRVSDIMTRNVITTSPETPIADIANLLESNRIKRVPVVADGKVIGIVSRANLVRAIAGSPQPAQGLRGKDVEIRHNIMARLKSEPWSPAWLNVRVEDGIVELWGATTSQAQKRAARVAAEITPGVVRVDDNIVVQQASY
jgi:CBS domain-containing protein